MSRHVREISEPSLSSQDSVLSLLHTFVPVPQASTLTSLKVEALASVASPRWQRTRLAEGDSGSGRSSKEQRFPSGSLIGS